MDLPPVTQVFTSSPKKNNIIVGDHEPQIRFFEQVSGCKARHADYVNDTMLLGKTGMLYVVSEDYKLELSEEVKKKTGMWAALPIIKGSAAIHALAKHAHTLAFGTKKPDKEMLARVEDLVTKDPDLIADIRALLWRTVEAFRDDKGKPDEWFEPWQSATSWMPSGVDSSYRLRTLYRKLLAYSLMRAGRQDSISHLKISASMLQKLKDVVLDHDKVYRTIELLGKWSLHRSDDYCVAAQVTDIWW